MTKVYKWRTEPVAGTEGDTTVYVDSSTGSDIFGLGTRTAPYQSLGKSWREHKVGGIGAFKKPTTIICRGTFSESLKDGNHVCYINGDYYGAASFNGENSSVKILYGFKHNKMMIINCMNDTTNNFAGVGAASAANAVGAANYVGGVAGSSVLLDNTALYWGVVGIGGTAAAPNFVCWSRPKVSSYNISLGLGSGSTILPNNTIYGCDISKRSYRITDTGSRVITAIRMSLSIIANFDMYADEPCQFTNCLFTSDVNWYYTRAGELLKVIVDKNEVSATVLLSYDGPNKTMTVGGGSGATKVIDIPTAITAMVAGGEIDDAKKPLFTTCKFSTQNSGQVFNNPENQDFTLRHDGDGVITANAYYGAFPPSLNIPILDYSVGVPGSWDENTKKGLIYVDDNCIKMDEMSLSIDGSIHSKVVCLDTAKYNLAAIYSAFISNFQSKGCALWDPALAGARYATGIELPIGRYVVQGGVTYNGMSMIDKDVVVVTSTGTSFTENIVGSVLIELLDSNISDVVYVRSIGAIYYSIKQGDGLQEGGTYLNSGDEIITYKGRSIHPKESFVAEDSVTDFVCSLPLYKIGVIFDDTRVPATTWIPAQLYGEFFVVKEGGAIKLKDGVPVSSGNYWAYQPTIDGGFIDARKTPIKQRFVQFKFVIKCVYDNAH